MLCVKQTLRRKCVSHKTKTKSLANSKNTFSCCSVINQSQTETTASCLKYVFCLSSRQSVADFKRAIFCSSAHLYKLLQVALVDKVQVKVIKLHTKSQSQKRLLKALFICDSIFSGPFKSPV